MPCCCHGREPSSKRCSPCSPRCPPPICENVSKGVKLPAPRRGDST
jgi:hypothetical protein